MYILLTLVVFFFSSRRRHTRWPRDWSSDVCSSDLTGHYSTVVLASQQREGGELPIIFDNTAFSTRAIDPDDWTTLWNEVQAVRYLKNRVFYNTLEDKCLRLFSSD